MTHQIKALGKLVNVVMLKTRIFVFGFQKSKKKSENLEKNQVTRPFSVMAEGHAV